MQNAKLIMKSQPLFDIWMFIVHAKNFNALQIDQHWKLYAKPSTGIVWYYRRVKYVWMCIHCQFNLLHRFNWKTYFHVVYLFINATSVLLFLNYCLDFREIVTHILYSHVRVFMRYRPMFRCLSKFNLEEYTSSPLC